MKRKNSWQILRSFLNHKYEESKKYNDSSIAFVTRQEIMLVCNASGEIAPLAECSQRTIDKYRRMLTVCGYLEDVKRGVYKIVKEIPDISVSKLEQEAYPEIVIEVKSH